MKAERDQWPTLGADALLRLADAPVNDHQKFLLSDCLQAYLTLDEAGQALFETITKAEPYSRIQAMNKTPYDNGQESAMRNAAIALLESKYRSVPKPFLDRIGSLGYDDLLALVVRIPNAVSMESLFSLFENGATR
jgi:hypothetical protein